eukprot:c12622_g1_i2.p1 GENE.c12622_g1_i2~~c12622_g1_i2.p1  ORF type:complete len:586 (+),score=139.55 c12622_g1_i2:131-1888(+)
MRPSQNEVDELTDFLSKNSSLSFSNYFSIVNQYHIVHSLATSKKEIFSEIDNYRKIQSAITSFEEKVYSKSKTSFKFKNNSVISFERFRNHCKISLFRSIKRIYDMITKWEDIYFTKFSEKGIVFLSKFPKKEEIEKMENEINEIIRNDIIYCQPVKSQNNMIEQPFVTSRKRSTILRLRPLLPTESNEKEFIVPLPDHRTIRFSSSGMDQYVGYDSCIGPDCTQSEAYELSGVSALVQELVTKSQSSTVIAYGQVGGGKTHTINGPTETLSLQDNDALIDSEVKICTAEVKSMLNQIQTELLSRQGLLPQAARQIFKNIEDLQGQDPSIKYTVKISCAEIVSDHVRDLLNPSSGNLSLVHSDHSGIVAKGLREVECSSLKDLLTHFYEASVNRVTSKHSQNDNSSKNHSITTLIVTCHKNSDNSVSEGKLSFVDLAGTEKTQKVVNLTRKSSGDISSSNRALTSLARVITSLGSDDDESSVPFRDSVLTQLLSNSLLNTITVFIVCLAPSLNFKDDSLSSIHFANLTFNDKFRGESSTEDNFFVDENGYFDEEQHILSIEHGQYDIQAQINQLKSQYTPKKDQK